MPPGAQSRGSPSGSSPRATAASSRCSTARTSCCRSPARSRSPTSSRRRADRAAGPTTSRWSRARSRRRTTPSASSEVRRAVALAGHDRRLRHRGRHPGAAQLRGRRRLPVASSTRTPEYISTLATSTPISAHVPRRLRAAGLPDRQAPAARGAERVPAPAGEPRISAQSVCVECKRRGNVCVMVAHGTPCLGPVTHAGCGAICPAYDRGCYGCFGPKETPNTPLARALVRTGLGATERDAARASSAPSTPPRRRVPAGKRGRMSPPPDPSRRTRTIRVDTLARVEGEGAHVRPSSATAGRDGRRAAHLRAAALLRGAPARPRLPRGARHHVAHLRHLPGRLPDERLQRHRGRLRRRPSTAPLRELRRLLYCGEWIESHALHV